uniref:(California timema) hypothetical protein n=1 Tax=Timema californicum TaxID=61474 RepID=A0A7R9PDP0_TIMCA|nr:unnamed protein product [Timema californicum]
MVPQELSRLLYSKDKHCEPIRKRSQRDLTNETLGEVTSRKITKGRRVPHLSGESAGEEITSDTLPVRMWPSGSHPLHEGDGETPDGWSVGEKHRPHHALLSSLQRRLHDMAELATRRKKRPVKEEDLVELY